MRHRITKADLLEALRDAERERDAWQQVWLNPTPDARHEVFIPGREHDVTEYWFLHACHRASGPVLRIVDSEGWQRVYWLEALPEPMRTIDCPYRRDAISKCRASYRAYLTRKDALDAESDWTADEIETVIKVTS